MAVIGAFVGVIVELDVAVVAVTLAGGKAAAVVALAAVMVAEAELGVVVALGAAVFGEAVVEAAAALLAEVRSICMAMLVFLM